MPRSASKSKVLTVPFTLQNIGTVPAGGNTVFDFYAFTDRTMDDSDVALGRNFPVPLHLVAGKSQNLKFRLSVSPTLAAGSYFLVANINARRPITESSYTNDEIFSVTPIAVA